MPQKGGTKSPFEPFATFQAHETTFSPSQKQLSRSAAKVRLAFNELA
jgi:hypothetical protein